jgi:hypothetical protein
MNRLKHTATALAAGMTMLAGGAIAHDIDEAGTPVCIEANYMMADAQNAPFASANGPGRVIEMNIFTGTPGITVGNPFNGGNAGTDICPDGVVCPGPWKPTGVLSGGENGHAFITSAGQQALTEFHRDGTPIRTRSYKALLGNPTTGPGPAPPATGIGAGTVPRPLGTQLMPNGNLIQAICDANFFNAPNSDVAPEGGLEANQYFPPVSASEARQDNSRFLVIDQVTMQVIDEYSRPKAGEPGHELWGCPAGIMFSDDGMYVSTFHGAAVLRIDWKAGIDNEKSEGVGSNAPDNGRDDGSYDSVKEFALGRPTNRAVVTGVVDFRLGEPLNNSGYRRDSLRAISFDESANIYATDRARSDDCVRGEIGPGGCNPGVFRQRVSIASYGGSEDNGTITPGGFDSYNDSDLRRTIGLDPGVNVIAGIRTNRMSGPGCDHVMANTAIYSTDVNPNGYAPTEDLCDVETLLVAASSMNPGDILDGCSGADNAGGGNPNRCFIKEWTDNGTTAVPSFGGGVAEYIIHPNFTDGGIGNPAGGCSGDPSDIAGNQGCAQPIARFYYTSPDSDDPDDAIAVDPRMLMVIHEAFGQ